MNKLHKITYAVARDQIDELYHRGWLSRAVDAWLEANCRAPYYHSPGYLKEKFIEFENDAEAVAFALKWGH